MTTIDKAKRWTVEMDEISDLGGPSPTRHISIERGVGECVGDFSMRESADFHLLADSKLDPAAILNDAERWREALEKIAVCQSMMQGQDIARAALSLPAPRDDRALLKEAYRIMFEGYMPQERDQKRRDAWFASLPAEVRL